MERGQSMKNLWWRRRSRRWRRRSRRKRWRRGRQMELRGLLQWLRLLWLHRRGLRLGALRLLEIADVWPLSQLEPSKTVCRCLMPCCYVYSRVGEVSSKPMTKVELRSTSRARMIHPGREELARQPFEVHSVDVTCPAKSTLCKTGVKRFETQARLKLLLMEMILPHVPQRNSAHHAYTSVVKHL